MADYQVTAVGRDSKGLADFLALPRSLYRPGRLAQNEREERTLFAGTHVLSSYFSFEGFVCYDSGQPVARCALALYPEDTTAYLGFFESIDDTACAATLFSHAEQAALVRGHTTIKGPVNASFWIGYRMKASHFQNPPYFSEPYNKEYYPALWAACGYSVCDRYLSNLFGRVPPQPVEDQYSARLAAFQQAGYIIRSPRPKEFPALIGTVYDLIMALYSDFPVFMPLSREDFIAHYGALRYALAYPLTKIAYRDGKPVGFFISVPDYGNTLNGGRLWQLASLISRKIRCNRYVLLYMGVLPEHRGLGKAIAQTVIEEIRRRQVASIGAFIHVGKQTEAYGEHVREDQMIYLLFEKELVL